MLMNSCGLTTIILLRYVMSCVKNAELDGIDLTAEDSIKYRQQLATIYLCALNAKSATGWFVC